MNKPASQGGSINNTVISTLKFVLAVLLIPTVWATSVAFYKYIAVLPGSFDDFFFWGMFGFLICFLFFYQFWGIYELGQKFVSGMFKFMAPANDLIAKVLPFYLTVILLLMYLATNFFNVNTHDHYFLFFAGFSFTMHVLLTAQDLQQQEFMFIKPTYLLMVMIVTVLTLSVVVLLFDLVLGEFLFLTFIKSAIGDALNIYSAIGERLFGQL